MDESKCRFCVIVILGYSIVTDDILFLLTCLKIVDIDYCADSPCVNGECEDLPERFECHCDPGWEGTTCDEGIYIY